MVEPRDHAWHLEGREIARHTERRGRRHAFERLDPERTAFVVIDMVPFFVADQPFALGIVPRVNAAAATMRVRGGVVAWVVPAASRPSALDEEFYGSEVAARYAASGGEGPIPGRLWSELAAADEDLYLEKRTPSAFFPGGCELDDRLRERGVESVLVAGTVANVCCESTARDARTLDYRVVMLADACAAPTDEMLHATLRTIHRSFGDVRATAELAGLLGDR